MPPIIIETPIQGYTSAYIINNTSDNFQVVYEYPNSHSTPATLDALVLDYHISVTFDTGQTWGWCRGTTATRLLPHSVYNSHSCDAATCLHRVHLLKTRVASPRFSGVHPPHHHLRPSSLPRRGNDPRSGFRKQLCTRFFLAFCEVL